jgi:hypothetical protein
MSHRALFLFAVLYAVVVMAQIEIYAGRDDFQDVRACHQLGALSWADFTISENQPFLIDIQVMRRFEKESRDRDTAHDQIMSSIGMKLDSQDEIIFKIERKLDTHDQIISRI